MKNLQLKQRLIKTARRSKCRYKIAALGLDKEGNLVGTAHNLKRYPHKGGGIHAEMRLLHKYPAPIITEMWIVRLGQGDELRPIECCPNCRAILDKLDIKVRVLQEV